MKRALIYCMIAFSFSLSSFGDGLYCFDRIPYYASVGSTTVSYTSYSPSVTNDLDTLQLIVASLRRGIHFENGRHAIRGTAIENTSISADSFIFSVDSPSHFLRYNQMPLLELLDILSYNLYRQGFVPSDDNNALFQVIRLSETGSNVSMYFNCYSLPYVSSALAATNTPFRAYVLDSLSGLSSDVRDLVLNSSVALQDLSSLVAYSQLSSANLSSIAQSSSSSASNLFVIANSFSAVVSNLVSIADSSLSSASNLVSIADSSFSSASNLVSISRSSAGSFSNLVSIADSSLSSASTLSSAFDYLVPSNFSGGSPFSRLADLSDSLFDDTPFHYTSLLGYTSDNYSDFPYLDKLYSGFNQSLFLERVKKYQDAVSTIPLEDRRELPESYFDSLFNDPGRMDQMIANFRYNTPISTNMMRIVTNELSGVLKKDIAVPMTNSIMGQTHALTNSIDTGFSDVTDLMRSILSNNHVIVDNQMDHPVPVVFDGDMAFSFTLDDATIFAQALSTPEITNLLACVTNELSDLLGFTTNELLHIHYNDFYTSNNDYEASGLLADVLSSYGIEMNTSRGFWSLNYGSTLLQAEFIASIFYNFSSITSLISSCYWFSDERDYPDPNFFKTADRVLSSFPSKTQLIDYIEQATNAVSSIDTNAFVASVSSFTNVFSTGVQVFGHNFSVPTKDLVFLRYFDHEFTIPVNDLSQVWYLIHWFMAFAICLVNVVYLPKFILFVIRRFMVMFDHSLKYLNGPT